MNFSESIKNNTFIRVFSYLKNNGISELSQRIKTEIRNPSTSVGMKLLPISRFFNRVFRKKSHKNKGNVLYAFYDLSEWPITYDFVWFLTAAELKRISGNYNALYVVLLGNGDWSEGPENNEYLNIVTPMERRQRLYDILLPLTGLLPSVSGVSFFENKKISSELISQFPESVFPEGYTPEITHLEIPFPKIVIDAANNGQAVQFLESGTAAIKWVLTWKEKKCPSKDYITITLRNYSYNQSRNSDLVEWLAVAEKLEALEFYVVFIPETHTTLSHSKINFKNYECLNEAAWNVSLRSALYENSYINLGVSTGPMGVCWFNKATSYITFKMIVEDVPSTQLDFVTTLGVDTSKQFPFATKFQRTTTLPDNRDYILKEFESMQEIIEKYK